MIFSENDYISKSGLDKIEQSPLDFWYNYIREDREPYVQDKKTAFDEALRCKLFTPAVFDDKFGSMPAIDRRTNIGKAEYDAVMRAAAVNNKILIVEDDFRKIIEINDAVYKNAAAKTLFSEGQVGQPTRYLEKNTGAPIKYIPHWINKNGIVAHVTTTSDASLSNFQKEAYNFRHDKRAYIQTQDSDTICFVSIESEAPYKIGIRFLDERSLDFGRETVIRNCETYLQCLESGIWPGIEPKITEASLPEWVFKL